MNEVLQEIYQIGIVPVITLNDIKDAKPLAKALLEGGLPCAEVTFRTEAAEESIGIMSTEFPEMLVGAGTVLTTEQVERAVAAGAKFIVSPGLNPEIVTYCMEKKIPVCPGISSPSEVEQAIRLGLDTVKFFPAEAAGGVAMIKAMAAPYGNMRFMPAGGINANNLNDYLSFEKIIACGGSWMVKPELIKAGAFDRITELTKEAINNMLGFELRHVGINAQDEKEADEIAKQYSDILGLAPKAGIRSIFAGSAFEIMKKPGRGANGHIAIAANSVDRAVYYLSRRGYRFDWESASYDADGRLKLIYLDGEIGGFAVHFVNR